MSFSLIAARLDFPLDAEGLRRDLDALTEDDWARHFNEYVFEGVWRGAAFRAPGGDAKRLYPDFFDKDPMADTPLYARCPTVTVTMQAFGCPLLAVRFLSLEPGARIKPHKDYDLGFDRGEVRLHAAVRTTPEVRFEVSGVRIPMQPGELWYADFSREHTVENPSTEPRVHLVIDCVVNDWLRALVAGATDVLQPPSAS